MNRHSVFAIISAICGLFIYLYIFPELKSQDGFLYKLLVYPFQHIEQYLPFAEYLYFILAALILAILIFFILEILWLYIDEKPLTSRGSARWANKADIEDLLSKHEGVPVGKFNKKILHIDKHLVTCSATGSGKGIGAIIPTLLEYPDSVICLDVKGENYAVTANKRRKFSSVFALNPFGVFDIPTASYNWLDAIKIDDPNCITKAERMASMIVGRSSIESIENHFNEQAIRFVQGVILYVCSDSNLETRNICTVKDLIHKIPMDILCKEMSKKDDLAFGEISSIGEQFLNNPNEKEKGSILSTAQKSTNFLGDPNIRKTLIKSDFDIFQLPNRLMSVYLIMDPDQAPDYSAYIRVFFDLALNSLFAAKGKGKYRVLFLLDEVAQLGYMKNLANAISILRGYGGQLWFLFQSYAQLKNIYGKDADNILSNSAQIFYGCNDMETSTLISRTLGKRTIKEYDKSTKKYNIIGRDLLSPDEARQLSPENPIIFIAGTPAIKAKRLNYLKDKEYRGQFDKNPYF